MRLYNIHETKNNLLNESSNYLFILKTTVEILIRMKISSFSCQERMNKNISFILIHASPF